MAFSWFFSLCRSSCEWSWCWSVRGRGPFLFSEGMDPWQTLHKRSHECVSLLIGDNKIFQGLQFNKRSSDDCSSFPEGCLTGETFLFQMQLQCSCSVFVGLCQSLPGHLHPKNNLWCALGFISQLRLHYLLSQRDHKKLTHKTTSENIFRLLKKEKTSNINHNNSLIEISGGGLWWEISVHKWDWDVSSLYPFCIAQHPAAVQ